ncbi:hypothetical protein B0T14DRAFT_503198 [Immersiella caudata]|uniref:DUF1776-domain-containing protein n=1 Tax=Immersiella caudata TaxID=314043 RepID=A0AA39XE65_9PEZI|nr:hypothetical protein B0T14DRAFT_503198 [Immersiella caudata]
MSADDQAFLDVLSSIPNDVKRYSVEVADFIDKNIDQIADIIRESLAGSPYVPEILRPRLPPPTPPVLQLPATALEKVQNWISRHKFLTGFIVIATSTIAYRTYRSNCRLRKVRRARRAGSGGRMDVVVIAGSPALPLTRSLSLDMERKGFIVYIVCNSHEDEVTVQRLSRPDIQPLTIDTTNPPSAGNSIERFAQYLQNPQSAIPRGRKHHISLKAVILIPSLNYQTSPIATIPPSSFYDLFNTHLLQPILTIQAFLPLLTARLGPVEKFQPPKVMVFTPSIISSINPPFHAPEATVCSALSAFTEVLAAELRPLAIPVTHVQLGTFDFAGFTPSWNHRGEQNSGGGHFGLLPPPEGLDTNAWPDSARQAYAKNYLSQSSSAISNGMIRGMRGSSLRDLHNAVFDVIDGSNTSGVVRVGLGASVYGFVGRFVPRGLVAWMMGIRRVDELATWQSSSYNSPRSSGSDNGEASHESFVAVPPLEQVGDAHVWKET